MSISVRERNAEFGFFGGCLMDIIKLAAEAANDKKARDLVALDISAIASFADQFLICTGDSSRQIQAISDEIEMRLKASGVRPYQIEGRQNAEWVVMDYSDLVVHIFSKTARAYYDLERLWRDAVQIELKLE